MKTNFSVTDTKPVIVRRNYMTPENIKKLHYQTQNLMYDFNYEVTLGIETFENCFSLSDVNPAKKATFPKSLPEEIAPILVTKEDFREEVNDTFDYRGDNLGVSLQPNEKQVKELKSKQNEIREFIGQFIKAETQIISYRFLEGLPGYPVFWD